jgi:hypothetical protein
MCWFAAEAVTDSGARDIGAVLGVKMKVSGLREIAGEGASADFGDAIAGRAGVTLEFVDVLEKVCRVGFIGTSNRRLVIVSA